MAADRIDAIRETQERISRSKQEIISFREYVEKVQQQPHLAETAHQRIYRMIEREGYEYDESKDVRIYQFFADDLFGIEDAVQTIVEDYFRAAARKMDVHKRMILMVGPPGSGKSTLAILIKRGLERFTASDEGAVYAIQGCPMNEEPLHLVPKELRETIEDDLGVSIEGELCPYCRWRLENEYNGDPTSFKVERIVFSEAERRGIGTFVPSDKKNQDISELVGSTDISKLAEFSESDPRAYRFDGELNVANRGFMEFVEVFKAEREFLNKLIPLCEEKQIKSPRFSFISADEVVLSHTNETEFNRFMGDPQNEALRDRIEVVKVPYNLRLDDEVKIQKKLIGQSNIEEDVHIAPHALEAAAHYAIMTRLDPDDPDKLSLLVKALNGEEVGDMTERDIEERLDALPASVGMFGLSPRQIIDAIASASIKDVNCLFFTDVLKELKRRAADHASTISEIEEKDLENYVITTRSIIDEKIKDDVQKAFVIGFADAAKTLFDKYLDHIKAYCDDDQLEDPVTGEMIEPDERLMREIEEQIGVSSAGKDAFREQIWSHIGRLAVEDKQFDWNSIPNLREAIEKKLFTDVKDFIRISTSPSKQDEQAERRLNSALDRLVEAFGYCPDGARKAVKYVGQILE